MLSHVRTLPMCCMWLPCSTSLSETGSSLRLKHIILPTLSGQHGPLGLLISTRPLPYLALRLHVSVRDLNAGTNAAVASTLPTEPPPSPNF